MVFQQDRGWVRGTRKKKGDDIAMLKGAYIFVIPDADPKKHRAKIETPTLSVAIVGVKDFDQAADIAKSLVKDGVQFIDLCSGYGPVGAAKVIEAVGDKIPVSAACFGIESTAKAAVLFS